MSKRILVVEDQADTRQIIRDMLASRSSHSSARLWSRTKAGVEVRSAPRLSRGLVVEEPAAARHACRLHSRKADDLGTIE
jgi:CheY-like chemotaxis protein